MSSVETKKSINKTYCSVPQCNTEGTKNPTISFHRFPADTKQRLKWKCATRIGKPISSRMCVCSKHFKKNDYFYNGMNVKRKRLKRIAVPSLNLPVTSIGAQKNLPGMLQKVKTRSMRSDSRNQIVNEKRQLSDSDSDSGTSTEEVSEKTSNTKPDIVYLSVAISKSADHNSNQVKQNSENVNVCSEKNELEISEEEATGSDNTSDLDEQINNLTEIAVDFDHTTIVDCNSVSFNAEILKQELEEMASLYVETQKELKLCQQKCKQYEQRIIALEEIINNFKQVNTVTDDS